MKYIKNIKDFIYQVKKEWKDADEVLIELNKLKKGREYNEVR